MNPKAMKTAAVAALLGSLFGATSALAVAQYASRPFLHRANSDLRSAKLMLSRVTHNCGGHRAAAVQKINDALTEVQAAVQYADAHPQEDAKH